MSADAIVVGSGPNGLAAAVTLARSGLAVHVIEGADTPGGGCRTDELTRPGFRHDVCSAVHPLAAASPFFRQLDLAALGVTLRTPKVAFAHPLDGGRAAWLAGAAAHTMRPLTAPVTGAFGLTLMMIAHAVGWPVVEGGSARLVDALVAELTSLGGTLETGRWVTSLADLPAARAVLLDVTPRQLVALAGESIGARSRRTLERFRYGTGVCKVDWALSGPVPWQAAPCREAGTVHVGGTFAEVARA